MNVRQVVFRVFSAIAIALLMGPAISHAQAVYGSIYGTVTDSTGAAVPGATITVTDTTKGNVVTATTNGSGGYTVQNLITDIYDVKATATGFEASDNPNVRVYVDTAPKVDFSLKVGAATQTVEVSSAAPLLNTDKADVAMILNDKYMTNLPLQNQNFTSLELLLPGAQPLGWSHATDENPQGSRQIQIDGQFFSGVGYELDGTDNQDAILGIIIINPIPDDVNEAKFTTQNYDSQFGMAVSSIITVDTKSGTNSIHGTAYDYRQSNANLAREPFSQFTKSAVPGGLQNQFGGNVGGPIIKDKLFYFVGYMGLRQRIGSSQLVTVPTTKARTTCSSGGACDLSDYLTGLGPTLGQIYDPASNGTTPFVGDIIPAGKVNAPAAALIKGLPDPTIPGQLFNNYAASGNGIFNNNQFDLRIDDAFSQTLHAFGTYHYFSDIETGGTIFGPLGGIGFGLAGYGGTSQGRNQDFSAGIDDQIHPNLLTAVRVGYHRYHIGTSKYDGQQPFATDFGIPGLNVGGAGQTGGAPDFEVNGSSAGAASVGMPAFGSGLAVNRCNCPLTETEDQFQLVNDWTKIAGNHIIKFGTDLRYARNLRVPSDANRAGVLTFNASSTQSSAGVGGITLASFMLGNVGQLNRYVSAVTNAGERQKRTFFYAEDAWHPTSNLTINYGLRYEIYFPETVTGKELGSLLNLHTGNLQVAGVGPYGSNMGINNNFKLFAPRLGVEYQVNPKTVIRTGYGRSYDIGVFGSIFGHASTQNLPVLAKQNSTPPNTYTPVFTLGQAPPTAFFGNLNPTTGLIPLPNGINANARPLTERLPTIDAWNLSLQNQVSNTLAVTLAYVGNKGTHTFAGEGNAINPNQLALTSNGLSYNPCLTKAACAAGIGANAALPVSNAGDTRRRPYFPKFGWTQDINYFADNANTHYNALQVSVDKQLSHGLQFSVNYAWQRAFSYGNNYYAIDPKAVYGRDTFLREQAVTAFGTWLLPFGRKGVIGANVGNFMNEVIGGWELDTIATLSSGLPYWPSYANCNAERDTGPCTPNIQEGAQFHTHLTAYNGATHSRTFFTPVPTMQTEGAVSGPFQRPLLDQFGNLQRNSFRGPSFFNEDFTLQKNFPIKKNIVVTARVDAFNAFNHINPGNPNGCIDCTASSGAGVINGEAPGGAPRQLQFALRAAF